MVSIGGIISGASRVATAASKFISDTKANPRVENALKSDVYKNVSQKTSEVTKNIPPSRLKIIAAAVTIIAALFVAFKLEHYNSSGLSQLMPRPKDKT